MIDTVATKNGDVLHVTKNDFGYLALNKRTGFYFYISKNILSDGESFWITSIDEDPFISRPMTNKEKVDHYCELYGIIPHKITSQWLIYYANYPAHPCEPRHTYKVKVRLSDMKEFRKEMKKWNPLGDLNLRK
jgi:hypothetical protein